ncbi:MAG: ATP-dependent zinc metalloprotease FtsH [Candidatus Saganbacteria bacterium]|nr:ATP-dependent zinc metalloprotease FtsH [Candidatus Saganbacteria bacterium]
MKDTWKNFLIYGVIALIAIGLLSPFFGSISKQSEISFSQFLNKVDAGQVKDITIAGDVISGKTGDGKLFKTRAFNYPNLVQTLRNKKIDIRVEQPAESGWLLNFVIQIILPLLFFAALWWLLIRQAQSANTTALSFGRSRAKPLESNIKVTFADVAGIEEAKEELKEIVEFLKTPQKFKEIGAKIPKGVLLMGPPGTGKTLLARAIAGEAEVPFFSLSGSDFVEMFVGVGASRVRDLFTQAKKNSPCIIFMDEIDAVGRHRGAGLGGGHDEREQTLNQLLVEMDGFDPKINVIVIAATNRPDILDPALLRPGRFDRQVVLDKPDIKGRKAILEVHAQGKKIDKSVDLEVLARRTSGFTGADLENLLNEAAILAARRNKKQMTMPEAEEAIDRILAGPAKRSKVISEKEKDIVAHHEVGHALLAKLLPHADPVHKISILPRGFALGYTLQLPLEDKYLITKEEVLEQVIVMLGGRVAEELVFSEMTSGAHNDLERATELVRKMVCEYGMSSLGPRTYGKPNRQVFLGRDLGEQKDYSDMTADAIDKEINGIINACHEKAKKLLIKNREKLTAIAKDLREKETLEGEHLDKYFVEIKKETEPVEEKIRPDQGILFA